MELRRASKVKRVGDAVSRHGSAGTGRREYSLAGRAEGQLGIIRIALADEDTYSAATQGVR